MGLLVVRPIMRHWALHGDVSGPSMGYSLPHATPAVFRLMGTKTTDVARKHAGDLYSS